MPALYNKLLEAKKGSLIDLASLETPSAKSQSSMSIRASRGKESSTTEATTRDRSRVSMFITEKEGSAPSLVENGLNALQEGTISE